MKILDLYRNSSEKLKNRGISTSNLDVKVLLSFVLDIDTNELVLHFEKNMTNNQHDEFIRLLERRLKREPIANIINKKSFWNHDFYVNKDVLTPRSDSETLIEAVIDNYQNSNMELKILDLGTGSGCLILTLLKIYENSSGIAVDISEKALNVAKRNADILNVKRIQFLKNNWNDGVQEKFDIIISNPPYIPKNDVDNLEPEVNIFNPILSLIGGDDGLDYYRYLAKNLKKNLKYNGKIFLEIGKNQENDVANMFLDNNFKIVDIYKDLAKVNRVLCLARE